MYVKFLSLIFIFLSCTHLDKKNSLKNNDGQINKHDTVYIHNNNIDWQQGFGLMHDPDIDSVWGKPVKYYIDNKNCSPIAIDFYYGSFRPTDNNTTAALLSLTTTTDNNLRPFYRWCLNKTILIQDGALAEYTGEPARAYAEKFPKEFFEYMDSDTSKEKYNGWVDAIRYSIPNGRNYNLPENRQRFIKAMKNNCHNCNEKIMERIKKFIKDCIED